MLLGVFSLTACYYDGAPRALSCRLDGNCTAAAPQGLSFMSSGFAEQPRDPSGNTPLPQLALQGSVTVRPQRFGPPPTPLEDAFVVQVLGPANITAERVESAVRVVGTAPGEGTFRLSRESDRAALDHTNISVGTAQSLTIRPWGINAPFQWFYGQTPWAIYRGGTFTVVVKILGTADARLVDEGSLLEAVSGATVTRLRWDAYSVTAGTDANAVFRVRAAGMMREITVPVVNELDRISLDELSRESPFRVIAGQSASVCFLAHSGGRIVVGVPFTYTVSGAAILAPPINHTDFYVDRATDRGCLWVESRVGMGQVTGTVAGRSMSLTTEGIAQ